MKIKQLLYPYYETIEANWKNRYEWEGWQECLFIASQIGATESNFTLEEKVERFVWNWKVESTIADALHLEFFEDGHDYLHPGFGTRTPDLKGNNLTYEVKTTSKYEYDDRHWGNADVHLYYNKYTGMLYEQLPDNHYHFIMSLDIKPLGE